MFFRLWVGVFELLFFSLLWKEYIFCFYEGFNLFVFGCFCGYVCFIDGVFEVWVFLIVE